MSGGATVDDADKIAVRSLHVIGERDRGKAESETIMSWFSKPITIEVPCAHELPMSLRRHDTLRATLVLFLSQAGDEAHDANKRDVDIQGI
jgi:hypothetical protein